MSVFLFLAGCALSQAIACDVPVFRYALERWPADQYRAVAVEVTPFTSSEASAIAMIRQTAEKQHLNLRVKKVSAKEFAESEAGKKLTPAVKKNTLLLYYPTSSGITTPVWRGDISSGTAAALSSCKQRSAATSHLLAGSSAVFLLLESGASKQDKQARILVEKRLKELNREIKLPAQVAAAGEADSNTDPINELKSSVPFKIDFTLLVIEKNAAVSPILRSCLLGLEPDLKELQDQPMLFAVYGRGRAMPPLIGKGINNRMIDEVAGFVTGACSCQVKNLNPGVDLLIKQDWDKAVLGGKEK